MTFNIELNGKIHCDMQIILAQLYIDEKLSFMFQALRIRSGAGHNIVLLV